MVNKVATNLKSSPAVRTLRQPLADRCPRVLRCRRRRNRRTRPLNSRAAGAASRCRPGAPAGRCGGVDRTGRRLALRPVDRSACGWRVAVRSERGGALPAGGLVAVRPGEAGPRLVATRLPAADEAVLGQGGAPSPDVSVMSLAGIAPDRPPAETGRRPALEAGEPVPAPARMPREEWLVRGRHVRRHGRRDGPSGPIGAGHRRAVAAHPAFGRRFGSIGVGIARRRPASRAPCGPSGRMWNCR